MKKRASPLYLNVNWIIFWLIWFFLGDIFCTFLFSLKQNRPPPYPPPPSALTRSVLPNHLDLAPENPLDDFLSILVGRGEGGLTPGLGSVSTMKRGEGRGEVNPSHEDYRVTGKLKVMPVGEGWIVKIPLDFIHPNNGFIKLTWK